MNSNGEVYISKSDGGGTKILMFKFKVEPFSTKPMWAKLSTDIGYPLSIEVTEDENALYSISYSLTKFFI